MRFTSTFNLLVVVSLHHLFRSEHIHPIKPDRVSVCLSFIFAEVSQLFILFELRVTCCYFKLYVIPSVGGILVIIVIVVLVLAVGALLSQGFLYMLLSLLLVQSYFSPSVLCVNMIITFLAVRHFHL